MGGKPLCAAVHQHRLRQTRLLERLLQTGLDRLAAQHPQRVQPDRIAAVVIEDRQRLTNPVEAFERPLAVHLPQVVGPWALEALQGRPRGVHVHQPVALEDAMHRRRRIAHAAFFEQPLELARAPAVASAQLEHLPFPLRGAAARRGMRAAAQLTQLSERAAGEVAIPSLATGRAARCQISRHNSLSDSAPLAAHTTNCILVSFISSFRKGIGRTPSSDLSPRLGGNHVLCTTGNDVMELNTQGPAPTEIQGAALGSLAIPLCKKQYTCAAERALSACVSIPSQAKTL